MAWPSSDVPTTNLDAGTDNPQTARADLLSLAQAVNLLRNHFSTFMRGVVEAVDAAAARIALGASTVGSNVFTAADAAAARSAIGATTVGNSVLTAADAAAARTAVGASTVGSNVFTAADQAAARSALGLPTITSGAHTPTAVNGTNVSASTPNAGRWSRIGNVVTWTGSSAVTVTASGTLSGIRFSLPVPSNFTTLGDVHGAGTWVSGSTPNTIYLNSSIANDDMNVNWTPTATGSGSMSWVVQYTVI